ncbi:unnamed protein product, partial [Vitis vinifera]
MPWHSLVWFPRNGEERLSHVLLIGPELSGILVLGLLDWGFYDFLCPER